MGRRACFRGCVCRKCGICVLCVPSLFSEKCLEVSGIITTLRLKLYINPKSPKLQNLNYDFQRNTQEIPLRISDIFWRCGLKPQREERLWETEASLTLKRINNVSSRIQDYEGWTSKRSSNSRYDIFLIDLYPRCVNILDTSVEPVFLPFEKWFRVICGKKAEKLSRDSPFSGRVGLL